MQKITPFLWFDYDTEEAVKFYLSVFKKGKVLRISRYAEGGPAPAGSVMTVEFQLFGQVFSALNGGVVRDRDGDHPVFNFNEAISFAVHCKTQREVDYYWRKLTSGGGKPGMCGWLKDKYGLSWQVVPTAAIDLLRSKDRGKAARAMQALMRMGKINMKGLQKASAANPAKD
jgi:predicted 3-demethylubiquinone-9 3-methyltransferase (glyoxalase superfamily)